MANESEISIEETNKIRLSLGLKPLKVDTPAADGAEAAKQTDEPDTSTTEGRERLAVDNWNKYHAEVDKEAARKARVAEIKRAKDAAQRFRKLEGKGLGEDDDEGKGDEDAATWLRKQKKRQKKLAERMAKEKEEELERLAKEQREYNTEDLKGLKVGHDLGDIDGETILTLKDATIDENEAEGDELISTEIAEQERLAEKLELKKKKPVYNAYDEAEGTGHTRILSQYDDETGEKEKKRFVLDGSGTLPGNETYRQEVAANLKQISLDIPKSEVASDYLDPTKTKIKKPKKKTRSTRKRSEDDEDTLAPAPAPTPSVDDMEVDSKPTVPKPKRTFEETSFVDDDDLQTSLALQRRAALKKRKVMKPSDIARQLREESVAEGSATPGMKEEMDEDEEEPGLVIDETSEFVAGLRAPNLEERRRPRSASVNSPALAPVTSMADSPEPEDESGDIDMIRDERSPSVQQETAPASHPEISSTGLEEETTISRGVGATLAMLNQRGLLQRDPEAEKKLNLQREREKFRVQKRMREIEAEEKAKQARARDRQSGKFDRMSAREREEHARWENRQRDQQEAREMAKRFENYKPDVNLSYKDEFGREMSKKEAFKYLSHQFHGKGSGKAKTEKRLKKIEDEKKREAASSLNVSATENAVQSAAKKTKQAGVRLM